MPHVYRRSVVGLVERGKGYAFAALSRYIGYSDWNAKAKTLTLAMSITTLLLLITTAIVVGSDTYFDTSGRNLYQLNILSEYELERYAFPPVLPSSEAELDQQLDTSSGKETILYRISAGPKSPKKPGKKPVFIENGILCDNDPCEVNKPKIAVAYILVDRGYDVWLGIGNTTIAESPQSSEENERKRLERVAQYILASTQAEELTVMGHFNGSVQFFGMTAPHIMGDNKSQHKFTKWLENIPGVKTIKSLYKKGTGFLTRFHNDVVEKFDRIGRKMHYITDDSNIRDLKSTVMKAWGFMMTMVIPTFSIKNFSDMMDHPDVFLDTAQLARKYGYKAESHQVETKDGYLLTVHRISGHEMEPSASPNRPAVLLQHGILGSSADFVMLGPNQSLAYFLSDAGYDVWLGNSRGNTYSKAHVNFSSSDSKFWEFSWHEMGIYDMPATVDYILNATGQKKLHYIGHSQGSTVFFVMLSELPEYNDKLAKAALFAPVANTTHARSPIIGVFSKISTPLYYIIRFFGVNDFLPTNALLTKIGREACEARSPYQVVCSNILFMITGYDASLLNKTTIPIILGHSPAGSSIKQFFHYAQGFKSKKFRQFDYGSGEINSIIYNQTEPPEYKVENVQVPVAIYYAHNDLLADSRDISSLAARLPRVAVLYEVPDENFNHISFIYATDAPKLIYEPLMNYLKDATIV